MTQPIKNLASLILLVASSAFAQQDIQLLAPPRLALGSMLPGACVQGDLFWLTGVTAGANLYGCTATNTWTLLTSSGTGAASIVITHTFTGTQELAYNHGLNTLNPLFACQLSTTPFTGESPGVNVTTPGTSTATFITASDVTLTCAFGTSGGAGTVTSILTTLPLTGGPATTSATFGCPTCATAASNLTNNAVVIGGGGKATSTILASTTPTNVLKATAGIPAFSDLLSSDLPPNTVIRGIPFTYGDPALANPIVAGAFTTDYMVVPYACTISAWNLLVDAGTIGVRFWKISTGTSIPSSGNSINTSDLTIPAGNNVHSTVLSAFTTLAIAPNDVIAMNVNATSGVRYVRGVLGCTQ